MAIGGALGSVARYLFALIVHRVVPPVFPFGTFAVNLTGCVAFGIVVGLAEHRIILGPSARAFLLIAARPVDWRRGLRGMRHVDAGIP